MARTRKNKVHHPYPILENLISDIILSTKHADDKEAEQRLKDTLAALFGDWKIISRDITKKEIPKGIKYQIGQRIREKEAKELAPTEFTPIVRQFFEEKYPDISKVRNANFNNIVQDLSKELSEMKDEYVYQRTSGAKLRALFFMIGLIANIYSNKLGSVTLSLSLKEVSVINAWLNKAEIIEIFKNNKCKTVRQDPQKV